MTFRISKQVKGMYRMLTPNPVIQYIVVVTFYNNNMNFITKLSSTCACACTWQFCKFNSSVFTVEGNMQVPSDLRWILNSVALQAVSFDTCTCTCTCKNSDTLVTRNGVNIICMYMYMTTCIPHHPSMLLQKKHLLRFIHQLGSQAVSIKHHPNIEMAIKMCSQNIQVVCTFYIVHDYVRSAHTQVM